MGCKRYTEALSRVLGKFLRCLGEKIAVRPITTIILSLVVTCIFGSGIFWMRRELNPLRLWVPQDSSFARDTEWLQTKFGAAIRPQFVLATAPNVLLPEVLAQLARISEAVSTMRAPHTNVTLGYEDVCFQIPIVSVNRKKRSIDNMDFDDEFFFDNSSFTDESDISGSLNSQFYCNILKSLPRACLQRNILELWKFNASSIEILSHDQIVDKINKTVEGPVFGFPVDYVNTLGGVKRDISGKIVSAESVLFTWYIHVNISSFDTLLQGNDAGTEVWATDTALSWESSFLEIMKNISQTVTDFNLYYEAGRSFGDLSNDSMFKDMGKLVIGIFLMCIYIQIILSKFNWVEAKFTLGSIGLLCVGLALIVSCGICSFIGIPFSPIHGSLPFLLMGLGIDDMFIMKACWEQMTDFEKKLPLPQKIGLMLEHAGTSIIVTSFTDIVAFSVGAITILPSLQSFCIYAAFGVFFIFIFAVTFYVAVFVLDIKRIENKCNGIIPCIKHPDFVPSNTKDIPISQYILDKIYSKFVFTLPVKICIILFIVIITGFSIESLFHLKQKFDPIWFIPENSYYNKYMSERRNYYPEMGYEATVFFGALNYSHEIPKIYKLIDVLENETNYVYDFDSWTKPFRSFVLSDFNKDIKEVQLSDSEWSTYISTFLHSPTGAKYQSKFRFNSDLKCGYIAPPVLVSCVDFRFKIFSGSEIHIPAMHYLQNLVSNANFTTGDKFATLWARVFANWITDEVIQTEVERNIELALVCVMICTFIIIGNFQMCFWIFICVLLTLINTCGWMHKMGLTIDIVSCVGLELGIGFCVDYAAHIGHKFLTVQGTLQERAHKTVTSIGAAVMYGGGSTLLSLSLLSFSEAYVFKTFFKIFLLVIFFGLFNGLLFLPVILSFIGPKPYESIEKSNHATKCKRETEKSDPSENINLNTME